MRQPESSSVITQRKDFGDFTLDMSPFIQAKQNGITIFKPGPLFHNNDTLLHPWANRQIILVKDDESGKTVPFDIITKGYQPVTFDNAPQPIEEPRLPVYLGTDTQQILTNAYRTLRFANASSPRTTLLVRKE